MSLVGKLLGAAGNFLGGGKGTPPKIIIEAFQKPNFSKSCGFIYLPLVSIETLEQKYAIKWNGGDNGGAQGQSAPLVFFQGYDTEESDLVVETIVDATGVYRIPETMGLINYDRPNIEPYIKLLKAIVYDFNSESHMPNYLQLTWGKIFASAAPAETGVSGKFNCVLKDMNVVYELFSVEGNPVRAKVKMTFKPFTPPALAAPKHSPDLTHIIEVKAGDTLPKLCNEIYDSTEYYHQVAQINKLPSAFALKPGMKLVFPPLDKFHR